MFHEITRTAIEEAASNPRDIDMKLVDAPQARRVLDRLVGYTLSPFLWQKVYRGLSAGRVQSVAVRLIVDREREIRAFVQEEYWTIDAELETERKESFTAQLKSKNGKKYIPTNADEAQTVVDDVQEATFQVKTVEEKDVKKNPPPPFTTSTLQQEAARKLGFSVKQTMVVAQQLYEGINIGGSEGQTGLITYMRTDSVSLSQKALADTAKVVEEQYGREYMLSSPRRYKTKSKGAQEAHEAIRPTELYRTPASLKGTLDHQQLKLYTLIWNRTIACQMASAELKRVGADIAANSYIFRATGQTVTFDGYYRVYREGHDESSEKDRKDTDKSDDKLLPALKSGDQLHCEALLPEQHFTKPPPRYTEASLVKKLEEEGIGRPSTYAPTISTIQQRGYIRKEEKKLVPEDVAMTVTDLLTEHFTDIVSLTFTAQMEEKLDEIAEGSQECSAFLETFYGPFESLVSNKKEEVKKEDVLKEHVLGTDPKTGLDVVAKIGRFGPYVQIGRKEDYGEKEKPRSASLKGTQSVENISLEDALALLSFPRDLGKHDNEDVQVNVGRYGPYIRMGKITVSIPDTVDPGQVDLPQALELIASAKERKKREAEPLKELGNDPNTKDLIVVKDGRYGPYVTDGKTNASIPKRISVDDIDLPKAVELLDRKRAKKGKK